MKNKKSSAWISLFEEVNDFMELHLEKWNHIEEIRRTYDDFVNNLKKIRDILPELQTDLSHVMKDLEEKRAILIRKLFPVGNILEVWAGDRNNGKKVRNLVAEYKEVETFSYNNLMDLSVRLIRLAGKSIPAAESGDGYGAQNDAGNNPSRYGLNRAMLEELHTAIQHYETSLVLRNDVMGYRKRVKQKRDGLITANRKLLKKRLNKLMTAFSGTHPSFYRDYCRAACRNENELNSISEK
jgi:hypothetical protein